MQAAETPSVKGAIFEIPVRAMLALMEGGAVSDDQVRVVLEAESYPAPGIPSAAAPSSSSSSAGGPASAVSCDPPAEAAAEGDETENYDPDDMADFLAELHETHGAEALAGFISQTLSSLPENVQVDLARVAEANRGGGGG